MESEKTPIHQSWRSCLPPSILAGVLPAAGLLAIYFFSNPPDALIWPEFTPSPILFAAGWIVAGVSCAASVIFHLRVHPKISKRLLILWVARGVLTAGWLGILLIHPALSFFALAALVLSAAFSAYYAFPKKTSGSHGLLLMSLGTALPLLLWSCYILAVMYMMLLHTP